MKKTLTLISLLCYLVLSSNTVSAAPNLWSLSFLQGFGEYGIVNAKGDSVIITCNMGAGKGYDNSVAIYLANNKSYDSDKNRIECVIADESYPISDESMTRSGSNAWDSFIMAIHKATQFEVYVDNKKIAGFSPNPNNVKKVLNNMDCASLVSKHWE